MPGDAITIAPHFDKVVLENDRVRVLEFRGTPGDKTELHSHPTIVAIALTDGKYRFTSPESQTTDVELTAGQAMYLDAVEHAMEIAGTTEARGLLVELT